MKTFGEVDRFTVRINNAGTDGETLLEVTTEPVNSTVAVRVGNLLPGIIEKHGDGEVVVFAQKGKSAGAVSAGHKVPKGTQLADGALDTLTEAARMGYLELMTVQDALKVAADEDALERQASKWAQAATSDPSMLDNLPIALVRISKCQGCGGYHPGAIYMTGSDAMEALRDPTRFIRAAMREVEDVAMADGFVVYDPDGAIGKSGFRDEVVAELRAKAIAALKKAVADYVGKVEASVVRTLDQLAGLRHSLADKGIALPEPPTRIAGLLATRTSASRTDDDGDPSVDRGDVGRGGRRDDGTTQPPAPVAG